MVIGPVAASCSRHCGFQCQGMRGSREPGRAGSTRLNFQEPLVQTAGYVATLADGNPVPFPEPPFCSSAVFWAWGSGLAPPPSTGSGRIDRLSRQNWIAVRYKTGIRAIARSREFRYWRRLRPRSRGNLYRTST